LAEGVVTALANGGAVETGTPQVLHNALDAKGLGWYKTTVASGRQIEVDLFCVSIGRMAFATAPYEMFCNNGMQLKNWVAENNLFDILFICENTNGENKYVATYRAFMLDADDNDGEDFEVDTCRYNAGVAEQFITEHGKMLRELSGRTDVEEPDFLQDAKDDWATYEYNPANMK